MALQEYQRKRDFSKTSEPPAEVKTKNSAGRFVVQKHAATRLHYDLRLEMDGVLKSWAVPKGMPFEHGEKHLAVHVEDHPVDYIDFEGTIPKGEYGGGTVMVWDFGTFEFLQDTSSKSLQKGKLHFALHGKKLWGEWYVVQLREEDQWLLIRGGESMRPLSKKAGDTSSLTGRSMKQIASGTAVWHSSKPRNSARKQVAANASSRSARGSTHAAALDFVEPMKAKLVTKPPAGGDWIYELKFDGYRALALAGGGQVRLLSRNAKSLEQKFPEVVQALSDLRLDDVILDGEIVALDEKGRSSFQLLQQVEMSQTETALCYYIFDVLRLNGQDSTALPLMERKAMLETLLTNAEGVLRYSAPLGADANVLLEHIAKLGLEGLIGKRSNSAYETGRRSGAWIKLKLSHEQEFVIGGYTNPEGSRKHFGALIVGVYQGKKLLFSGKVGTGFNAAMLRKLHGRMEELKRASCPFSDLPRSAPSRWGTTITASEMKRCHWIEPELVCQVKFAEWTQDNHLRQPSFLGLREDKSPTDVVRERAES